MAQGIQLTAAVLNTAGVTDVLRKLSGSQAKQAYAKALNDAGFQVRREMQAEMRSRFDRVTAYVERSPRVVVATPERLSVTIEPAYMGGKGVDPQRILQAQAFGGARRDKRYEVALRRAGILPNGLQTAIPEQPYPGSDDGRGNLRGPFIVQLLSYFKSFGEQGYKANMTDKRRRNVHRGTKKTAGRRYFVSYGQHRGGARRTASGDFDNRASNLPAGIWAASGTGGVDVRPVLMFVRAGSYRPLLDLARVAAKADVQNYLDRRVRFRVREAAGE